MFTLVVAAFLAVEQDPANITQAELVHRTQVLYDAVAPGNRAPWQQYLADDVIIHDEKGGSYTKGLLNNNLYNHEHTRERHASIPRH